MDGGARWAAVHEVAKSQTRLSDFTVTFHFPALEKEMATHSNVLAWRIPGTRAAISGVTQSRTQLKRLSSSSSSRSDLAATAAANYFEHLFLSFSAMPPLDTFHIHLVIGFFVAF